ncbi:MAG: starch-binding protein [Clostridia bacterium]|nr:starch-binding protein [Clostridia bacterium]
MKNNTRKILLALLLVFTLMMSLVTVSSFAEESTADDGNVTIYFQNNWLWTDVSCYYWGSTTGANPEWPGNAMTLAGTQDEYDVYSISIPADVEGLIINGVKNDGSGSRDQTPDIKTGIVDGAGWKMNWNDGNEAVAFTYNPSAAPTETSYTVAGVATLCGTEWDVSNTANDLTLGEDGVYSIVYTGVPAGEIAFKVVKNHSWAKAWPSSDYVLNLSEASDVTITFNPETETLNVSSVAAGGGTVTPDPDPEPTPDPEPAGADYYLVGWINGVDVADQSYKFVDGKLSINLSGDAYVAVMDANGVWYMTDGWLGTEVSEAVLYNQTTHTLTGEKFDKFFVPGGQTTISITENEDGSISITHSSGMGGGTVTPSEPAENPIQPENGYYKVYVYNTAWWDLVCYYVWDADGNTRADWPGQDAYEDTYLLYPIMIPENFAYVIFNNGDASQTPDIALISVDQSKTVYNNGTGEWMSIDDYDPNLEVEKPAEPEVPDYDEYEKIRVYLGNGAGWGVANVYCWTDGAASNAGWPGVPMEYDDVLGMFYADVPVCFEKIIFNDGTNQTCDLLLPALGSSEVVCDNTLAVGAAGGSQLPEGVDPWFTLDEYEVPDPILPPTEDVIIVFKNDAGWTDVYLHYWGGDSETAWPGLVMEMGADGLYFGVVPAGTTGIVFNNGGSWEDGSELKSPDLTVPTDGNNLFNNQTMSWSYYELDTDEPDEPENPGTEDPETPDEPTDDDPAELSILEKLWQVILNFFKSIGEFFGNLFGEKKL